MRVTRACKRRWCMAFSAVPAVPTVRVERAKVYGQEKERTENYRERNIERNDRAWAAVVRQPARTQRRGALDLLHPVTGRP